MGMIFVRGWDIPEPNELALIQASYSNGPPIVSEQKLPVEFTKTARQVPHELFVKGRLSPYQTVPRAVAVHR